MFQMVHDPQRFEVPEPGGDKELQIEKKTRGRLP
jgi:hypothetical protein